MDYNINLKYKAGGGGASSGGVKNQNFGEIRRKVIDAQKNAEKKAGTGSTNAQLASIKQLNGSMVKLNESIKSLTQAIRAGGGIGKGSGVGGSGGSGRVSMSAGLSGAVAGGVGSAMVLGMLGYTMHKISEIGNAYMDKTAEQSKSVGYGGFRYGQGMYGATEMGAGMKSYAMSTGRFQRGSVDSKLGSTGAMQVGGAYGLSAEEAFGQAGTFARAGVQYGKAAYTVAGGGIETQLPMLMQSMSTELEDAVKNGFDASEMGKNIAEDMTALTMATRNKDVRTADLISKSVSGMKTGGQKGQVSTPEELMAWQSAQKSMMSKMGDSGWRAQQVAAGQMTEEEASRLAGIKGGPSTNDVQAILGPNALTHFTKRQLQDQTNVEYLQGIASGYKGIYGSGPAALRNMSTFSDATGGVGSVALETMSRFDSSKKGIDLFKGQRAVEGLYGEVSGSASGMSIQRDNQRTNFMLAHGEKFAQATMKVETALLHLADSGIKTLDDALQKLGLTGDKKPKTKTKGRVLAGPEKAGSTDPNFDTMNMGY